LGEETLVRVSGGHALELSAVNHYPVRVDPRDDGLRAETKFFDETGVVERHPVAGDACLRRYDRQPLGPAAIPHTEARVTLGPGRVRPEFQVNHRVRGHLQDLDDLHRHGAVPEHVDATHQASVRPVIRAIEPWPTLPGFRYQERQYTVAHLD